MNIDSIISGQSVPWDINVVIEIPQGQSIKYEMDKRSGALFVDRFLHTAMYYPLNYGFIPGTMGKDGDPLDAMVLFREPVIPGAVIRSRPIGMLVMEDEGGQDEKIICAPHEKIDSYYQSIKSYNNIPSVLLDQIKHFFTKYKDLNKEKWVKIKC